MMLLCQVFSLITTKCRFAGAIGAEWLKAFKGYIENPTTMLL
jgi:hypothetical protein